MKSRRTVGNRVLAVTPRRIADIHVDRSEVRYAAIGVVRFLAGEDSRRHMEDTEDSFSSSPKPAFRFSVVSVVDIPFEA